MTLVNISKALAQAQAEIKGALKDSSNPFYKSQYADLSSVMDAIRDPFSKHGLSYLQPISTEIVNNEPVWFVETIILHASGEQISSGKCAIAIQSKNDPQKVGSSITYFRRYSLASMVGVAQIDDDANMAAQKVHPQQPRPPAFPAQQQRPIQQAAPKSEADTTKSKIDAAKTRLVPNYAPNGTPRQIND